MNFHQGLTSIEKKYLFVLIIYFDKCGLVGLGVQRPTCGEEHEFYWGGKLTQAGYCKVLSLRISFYELNAELILKERFHLKFGMTELSR